MNIHEIQFGIPVFMAGVGLGFFGGIAWMVGFAKKERS